MVQLEVQRDLLTIRRRVSSEGISFLTKSLPAFGKAIDLALSTDTPLQVLGFKKAKGSQLPRLLGWLLADVFQLDGVAREVTPAASIALKSLRQILLLFYKLEVPYDSNAVSKTLRSFKDTEVEMATFPTQTPMSASIIKQAARLVSLVVQESNPFDIVPKHGPGAVATGERPWEKPVFKRYFPELDAVYPYPLHMYFNPNHFFTDVVGRKHVELEKVLVPLSKVVLVPKDSRGPRLISMEPLELQWIQQGLKQVLEDAIAQHRYTRGHVNFTDQEINRNLALNASRDGINVTIDMKDASDRVSLALVQMLFPCEWVECLEACRSHGTVLPTGERVMFNKFAPMGSALCFPVESLVFWSLAVATIMAEENCLAWQAARQVFVFGDDLIMPGKVYPGVIRQLEAVGLRVNRNKCCTGSSFRESCGMDAYGGVQVTPVRIKTLWDPSLDPVQVHASYVAVSNRLYLHGYRQAAHFIENEVLKRKPTPFTRGEPTAIQFVRPDLDVQHRNEQAGIRTRLPSRNTGFHTARSRCIRPILVKREHGYRGLTAHWTKLFRSERRDGDVTREETAMSQLRAKRIGNRIVFGNLPLEAEQYSTPHRVSSVWGWSVIDTHL
jgi:hypothetical protein